jgi:hypothetical protein
MLRPFPSPLVELNLFKALFLLQLSKKTRNGPNNDSCYAAHFMRDAVTKQATISQPIPYPFQLHVPSAYGEKINRAAWP